MIQQYISYLRNIRGLSENTCRGYQSDLTAFAGWAKNNLDGARWSTITRADIDHYITDMACKGIKPATTNRALAAISGLYGYFKREGLTDANPTKFESRRKVAKPMPNTIPAEDIRRAYNRSVGVVHTMIGLLATTGIRIQELLDLTWEDIDFADCSIKILGKGAKGRTVYTTEEVLKELRHTHDTLGASGRMFFIDQRTARRMLWEVMKNCSNAPQLSPHAIRHTVATNLAKQGANVASIGAMLGHEQLKTTQKYIDAAQLDTRKMMEHLNTL